MDLISVVEAAYELGVDDATWIRNAADVVVQTMPPSLGCHAWYLDASDMANVQISNVVAAGMQIDVDLLSAIAVSTPDERLAFFGGRPVICAEADRGRAAWRSSVVYRDFFHPVGIEDAIGLSALDANRVGCLFGLFLARQTKLSTQQRHRYAQIAAHLGTGLRARRALRASGDAPEQCDATEAVLHPDGTLAHATAATSSREARAILREHAVRIDKARAKLRREDEGRALDLWTALVAGRWTFVDRFDTDGRRYLLACKNDPQVSAPLKLTPEERQVVAYVTLGHSNKLIAYELGRTQSWVSTVLRAALRKLGLSNRVEVAQALRPVKRA